MSKRPFMIGVLTGLVLTLALGFGAMTLAGGTSAAGTPVNFGDAVRGALARRDASPATGALSLQANDAADETDAANETDAEQGGSDRTMRAKVIGKALRRPGAFGHGAGDVTMLQGFTRAFDDEPGVLVAGVDPDGAAAAAGLARGDVITAIDGEPVDDLLALHERLSEGGAGETVTLSVTHGDETRELTVTLDEDADAGLLGFSPCGGGMMGMPGVMDLHHLEMMDGQAVVAGVEEGSAAEAAGLAEGDVITAIDGVEVESTDALSTAIGDRAPGDTISLAVQSAEGETREVSATLGEHPEDPERGFLGVMLGRTISIESGMLPEGMHGLPGGGQWFGEEGMLPFEMGELGGDHHGGLHFKFGEGHGMFDLDELEALAVDGRLAGAIVHDFTGDGPAEAAGLAAGDVITAIDGEPVDGAEALVAALEGRAPGETMTLSVARKGEAELLTISTTLGAQPEDDTAGWLGVEVGTLEMRFDGEGGIESESHMGGLRDHLREMLRGGDGDASINEGDGPRRFRMRIGPGGDTQDEPVEKLEIDLGGEA